MDRQRIQVYADVETKRRIELAALKHDVPVTVYCLEAIRRQLSDDDMLEPDTIEVAVNQKTGNADLLDEVLRLREEILAERGGRQLDPDILEQVRDERDEEIIRMH